jgi:hypothetical protein
MKDRSLPWQLQMTVLTITIDIKQIMISDRIEAIESRKTIVFLPRRNNSAL